MKKKTKSKKKIDSFSEIFKISIKRVIAAKSLLPVLRTLVAPIFPDPVFLTSCPVKILVKIKPNGIDPHKYEKEITKIISIFS